MILHSVGDIFGMSQDNSIPFNIAQESVHIYSTVKNKAVISYYIISPRYKTVKYG